MKPFLLLQSRPEDEAADNEYQAFLKFSELEPSQLERARVQSGDMPAIDLDGYSGIIVGGGPFNISDSDKSPAQRSLESGLMSLLDQVIERDFPFLGACYGIGLLTMHQSGIMSRHFGEDVGPTEISRTADSAGEPLLEGLPDKFEAFVGHKEACEMLPPYATLLATSENCPVQMMRIKQNVYATQFHPELDSDGLALRIRIYKDAGYFPADQAEPLIEKGYAADVTLPPQILKNFVGRYHLS